MNTKPNADHGNAAPQNADAQMIDLDAIKQRANAATDGPWEAYNANEDTNYGALWCVANEAFHNPPADEDEDWLGLEIHVGDKPDSDFIAHAREDVPALIAEVERLQGIVDRVRESAHVARHALHLTGDLDAREVLHHITTAMEDQ